MVARCSCGLIWNISIKTDLSKPYECPQCETKEKKIEIKLEHPPKCINKMTKVLLKNKNRVLKG